MASFEDAKKEEAFNYKFFRENSEVRLPRMDKGA